MAKKFLDLALQHRGLHEIRDNKRLRKLLAHSGTPIDPAKTAWCAAFINAILSIAGYTGTGKLTARSFLKWGVPVKLKDIQEGDIVVFKRGILPWQGHSTFYHSSGGMSFINCCGGNQANSVSVKPYSINKIIGIRRESAESPHGIKSFMRKLIEKDLDFPEKSAILRLRIGIRELDLD